MKVDILERGSTPVDPHSWKLISGDPGFADLVTRDIMGAKPEKHGKGWRLTAGNHVGNALLGGLEVRVVEKVPGAFAAMAEILSPGALKLAKAASPVVFGKSPPEVLIALFLSSARSYLSGAKLVEYQTKDGLGAFVSGRLNVPRTAALRARGTKHKVAFRRTELSDDLPLNRVVYAALGDVLANARGGTVQPRHVTAARALRAAFKEAALTRFDISRRDLVWAAVAEADVNGRRREAQEVAALAAAVLQAVSLTGDEAHQGAAPRSWFLNLENFFERAVRHCVTQELSGIAAVTGPVLRPPLFPMLAHRYRANPDVVIAATGERVLLDAKYKDLSGFPSTADVHELLAHSSAYGANRAALVYPSSGDFTVRYLGQATTGCRMWAFGISVGDLRQSIQKVLSTMGLKVDLVY